jgi:hypothetical protein
VISKRVNRKKKTSDFDRLGRYLLEAKTDADAILWTRTAEYVMDLKNNDNKVLSFRITNCEAEVPAMAMAEVLVTQSRNTRSKVDKTYHLVISFPDGERPTREQLNDIEDTICQALGFGEHQRLSAVHQDTDNMHLHLAINKVHPKTFKVLEPYRDFYTISDTCRLLEQRHGLLVDNGMGQGQKKGRAGEQEAHSGKQSLLVWSQERLGETLKRMLNTAEGWNDLHALLGKHGLVIKPRGAGLVVALRDGSLAVKASAVHPGLSLKKLSDRLGEYQPPTKEQLNGRPPRG